MTDQPVSVTLNTAADLIEANGHHKGSAFGGDGPVATAPMCAVGAITFATIKGGARGRHASVSFGTYLGSGIPSWNDAPERTAEEVVAALRACALIEAAREEQDAAWETYADAVSA